MKNVEGRGGVTGMGCITGFSIIIISQESYFSLQSTDISGELTALRSVIGRRAKPTTTKSTMTDSGWSWFGKVVVYRILSDAFFVHFALGGNLQPSFCHHASIILSSCAQTRSPPSSPSV